MAFLPAMPAAYSACWASVRSANRSRRTIISSDRDRTFPSLSVRETPRSSIYAATVSLGFARLVSTPRREVPAWLPLMPALAMSPMARAVSSME